MPLDVSQEKIIMQYDDKQVYAKYLKKKCLEEAHGGCEGCNEGCDDNDCSCCPPGLVGVYDEKGVHQGCLTPNDAELYGKSTFNCPEGYVVLIQTATAGEVYSCVSESEFAAIYAALNP
jgi:hypothetical protein